MRKEAQPHVRSARILAALVLFSAGLVAFSRYQSGQDADLFTRAPGPEQERFFVAVSERPDALPVFEKLSPSQRLRAARNLGQYQKPEVAKLGAILLDSFDPGARKALAESLSRIAQSRPDFVAQQLDKTSSYQTAGVFAALKSNQAVVPVVAKLLESDAHRANASRLLQEIGSPAVPVLIEALGSTSETAKVAAAEVLGKLRAREAVVALNGLIERTEVEKRDPYIGALLVVGDPKTESMARGILMDPTAPRPLRQQAATGLGRIGTVSAVEELAKWRLVEDEELAASVWDALKEAGDVALRLQGMHLRERIRLAAASKTPLAERVLWQGYRSSYREDRLAALRASRGRVGLAPDVAAIVRSLDPAFDGDLVEAAVAALWSTPIGRKQVFSLKQDRGLDGFIARQKALPDP
ncbi:MAG: hypothetical protein HZC36_06415 [Armatimonadetes bacterium]|nr:hypothetical protein [Armatimonadota bacterium]